MQTIKEILMERDGMTATEADKLINICIADLNMRLADGKLPDNICQEYFGLENDYIFELL